jgi:tetratricopeptide (TPR) repeat protein
MWKQQTILQSAQFRWASFAVLGLGVIALLYGLLTRPHTDVPKTLTSKLDGVSLAVKPIGSVWLTQSQVVIMERMYKEDTDADIAKTLLHHYISQGAYQQGLDMLLSMQDKKHLTLLDQDIVHLVAYNAAYKGIATSFLSAPLVPANDPTSTMLEAIAQQHYGNVDSMIRESLASKDTTLLPLRKSLQQAKQTYDTLRSAPSYYYTWLIAAALMEAWYTPYAQGIAEKVLQDNSWYILAHEIASQAAIKQCQYDTAIKHLQVLLTLDRQHIQRTSFFLGLSLYNMWDLDQAGLYFQQVKDPLYTFDALRYSILIAYRQKSYDRMMDWFRTLLQEKKAMPSDYLLLYDIVFYEPYRHVASQGSSMAFVIAQQYALSIVVPYIDSCRKYIASTTPYVCKYGEAWWYLSQWKLDKALMDLVSVSKNYPNPRIFQALGDYYLEKWNQKTAESFYKKALLNPDEISHMFSQEKTKIYSWNTAGE